MRELSRDEMSLIGRGDLAWTTCGTTAGATLGATLLYGTVGFLLTFNKALTACTIAVLTSSEPALVEP
jgi:hypothetical protein